MGRGAHSLGTVTICAFVISSIRICISSVIASVSATLCPASSVSSDGKVVSTKVSFICSKAFLVFFRQLAVVHTDRDCTFHRLRSRCGANSAKGGIRKRLLRCASFLRRHL